MITGVNLARFPWFVLAVFAFVFGADLAVIAAAGTDIPFHEQWDVEGRRLLPAWVDGSLTASDLFHPHNEHRIVWTLLLNLGLFAFNGQWDPLVQLVACGLLRAGVAAGLAGWLGSGRRTEMRLVIAAGVAIVFVPLAAWHNALWGFQTQVLFCVGFSLMALALLTARQPSLPKVVVGFLAGVAALFSMAPGLLVPVALLVVLGLRTFETRQVGWRAGVAALGLLLIALLLRTGTSAHADLQPVTVGGFLLALGRVLAWPHTSAPIAAVVMTSPLVVILFGRLFRKQWANEVPDFLIGMGVWAAAIALAAAWSRGGSDEWTYGVPSRYADFLLFLPVANAGCALHLARHAGKWQRTARPAVVLWGLFVVVGWCGLSVEALQRVILPRATDLDAPVRLTLKFQLTHDRDVFDEQPRLLIPHPNLELVRTVLDDQRLEGMLPPSLQPERPIGPLSRMVRWLLGR